MSRIIGIGVPRSGIGYTAAMLRYWGYDVGHERMQSQCPVCAFAITSEQARSALDAFKPYLAKSVEVFEQWCKGELPNDAYFNQFGYLHSTPKSEEPEE